MRHAVWCAMCDVRSSTRSPKLPAMTLCARCSFFIYLFTLLLLEFRSLNSQHAIVVLSPNKKSHLFSFHLLIPFFKQSDHSDHHHATPTRKRSILVNGNQTPHLDNDSINSHQIHLNNGMIAPALLCANEHKSYEFNYNVSISVYRFEHENAAIFEPAIGAIGNRSQR